MRSIATFLGLALAMAHSKATADNPVDIYATRFERRPAIQELKTLGKTLFSDPRLSASGKQSCASCHDPKLAFGPPNARPVQIGGAKLNQEGFRATPSLMYRAASPVFIEHYIDHERTRTEVGPTGGLMWDGRVSSLQEQVALPLLSPNEMANRSPDEVIERLSKSRRSANAFKQILGAHILEDGDLAWRGLRLALTVYLQDRDTFSPFNSKYDRYLQGKVQLSQQEARGLAVFRDPLKGNCASCHPSDPLPGALPRFTDDGFVAIGAPRNRTIRANQNPDFFDMGLCGPLRNDFSSKTEYCGQFKTPSLRNVAKRRVFFHNGVYRRLEDAVRFYALRDTQPWRIYKQRGTHARHGPDDLHPNHLATVNTQAPFGQQMGAPPVISEREVQDLVAFLKTLNDE